MFFALNKSCDTTFTLYQNPLILPVSIPKPNISFTKIPSTLFQTNPVHKKACDNFDENEKMVVTSIFFFSHNVFFLSRKCCQFEQTQALLSVNK